MKEIKKYILLGKYNLKIKVRKKLYTSNTKNHILVQDRRYFTLHDILKINKI